MFERFVYNEMQYWQCEVISLGIAWGLNLIAALFADLGDWFRWLF